MIKKLLKLVVPVAMVTALISCLGTIEPKSEVKKLTLRASNPAIRTEPNNTRTYLVGLTPYWSVGDTIGVYVHETGDNLPYKGNIPVDNAIQTAEFTGYTPSVLSTITAYYPYTTCGDVTCDEGMTTGAIIDIPAIQYPTPTSFDSRTDILLSQQIMMDENGVPSENIVFERIGGILKIVFDDMDGVLAGEHIKSLSVTADASVHLAGCMAIDLINRTLIAPYENGSNVVTATYTTQTQYAIGDADAATYFGVYPATLPNGSTLTITAGTEGHRIKKVITLPQDIEIKPGEVTRLNISLNSADHIQGRSLSVFSIGSTYGNFGSTVAPVNAGVSVESVRGMLLSPDYFGQNGTVKLDQVTFSRVITSATWRSNDPTAFIALIKDVDVIVMPGYGLLNSTDISVAVANAIVEWSKAPNHVLIITVDAPDNNLQIRTALGNDMGWRSDNILSIDDEIDPTGSLGIRGSYAYYGSAPDIAVAGDEPFFNGVFGEVDRSAFFRATDGTEQYVGAPIPSNIIPLINVSVVNSNRTAESTYMQMGIDVSKGIVWMGECQIGGLAYMTTSNPTAAPLNRIIGNLWAWIVERVNS